MIMENINKYLLLCGARPTAPASAPAVLAGVTGVSMTNRRRKMEEVRARRWEEQGDGGAR